MGARGDFAEHGVFCHDRHVGQSTDGRAQCGGRTSHGRRVYPGPGRWPVQVWGKSQPFKGVFGLERVSPEACGGFAVTNDKK